MQKDNKRYNWDGFSGQFFHIFEIIILYMYFVVDICVAAIFKPVLKPGFEKGRLLIIKGIFSVQRHA